jgi:phenylacetate-CoA ligase
MQSIRNFIFFGLDRFKGSLVSKHIDEIRQINLNPFSDLSVSKREVYLRSLLKEALNNIPFYKNLKLNDSEANLNEFPIINKKLIIDHYNSFISPKYPNLSNLKSVSTSGSTGVPFKVYHSTQKTMRAYADNLFFGNYVNYHVGAPVYYMRIWNNINKQSILKRFVNNTIPLNVAEMTDKVFIKIFNILEKAPIGSVLLGYGSAINAYGQFLQNNNLKVNNKLSGIWVMAEPVNSRAKSILGEKYRCPVLSRYSNSENGFIAHQYDNNSENYLYNLASYEIELLGLNNDRPVKEGEPGRVVVTDLFNDAFPMIRYDTGDIAIGKTIFIKGNKVNVFTSIEGRKLDFIYATNGDLISPHTIDYALRNLPNIVQFQFVQNGEKEYFLNVIANDNFEALKEAATSSLRFYLGKDAIINVLRVNSIPILNSGKIKLVVNNYNKQL